MPRMEHTAPRIPFSARHARVASVATANVLSVFPLSLSLQPHVLQHRHLLVRCLQKCEKQAPVHSAERFVRQLRRDGETAPAAAARRLSRSCSRCGLPRLCVTRRCADCGVLFVRCGGREDAVSVVEDGGGGAVFARVVAVRTVLRADGVRQLLRDGHVGGQDDAVSESVQQR